MYWIVLFLKDNKARCTAVVADTALTLAWTNQLTLNNYYYHNVKTFITHSLSYIHTRTICSDTTCTCEHLPFYDTKTTSTIRQQNNSKKGNKETHGP